MYIIFAFRKLIHKTRYKVKKKGYFLTAWRKIE